MSEGYDTPSAPRRTEFDSSFDPTYPDVPAAAGSTGYSSTSGTSDPFPTSGAPSTSATSASPDSTTGVAADQAKQVGQDALEGGKQVAGVAADQARSVASEAGAQAKNVLGEARSQLTDQASTQQNNLAAWLKSVVDELEQMANGTNDPSQSGPAASLLNQVSSRAKGASTWLEDHEPADLLSATSRFARQRPGVFLALAAAGGVLAGRLTRGLTADAAPHGSASGSTKSTGSPAEYEYPARSTMPVAPVTTTTSDPYTTSVSETTYAEGAGYTPVAGDDVLYADDLDEARRTGFETGTGTDRDFR